MSPSTASLAGSELPSLRCSWEWVSGGGNEGAMVAQALGDEARRDGLNE
jgi:hypothetical protein